MIGVYDYTVILTYLSLVSAMCGCIVSTAGNGHPYIGGFFLLFCGLCDTFDGKVARVKKNRTNFCSAPDSIWLPVRLRSLISKRTRTRTKSSP